MAPPPGVRAPPSQLRVELFLTKNGGVKELRSRVRDLAQRGVRAFNLVNKTRDDTTLEWLAAVAREAPESQVCVHYSLKYNAAFCRTTGADQMYERFSNHLRAVAAHGPGHEVLLVSGSAGARTSKLPLDLLACLRRLAAERAALPEGALEKQPAVGVAFNPYFACEEARKQERSRLRAKMESGAVASVWLQFGSDVERLEASLAWLGSLGELRPPRIVGSLFLPTPQLIAQQKYRPWNGVFLSGEYLSGAEAATAVTRRLLQVYRRYGVEVLVEAPGVRKEKDLLLVEDLLRGAGLPCELKPPLERCPSAGSSGAARGSLKRPASAAELPRLASQRSQALSEAQTPRHRRLKKGPPSPIELPDDDAPPLASPAKSPAKGPAAGTPRHRSLKEGPSRPIEL